MLAIVSLIILILIFGVIFLHYSSELAFKRIFLKHKKNKEEAFLYLKDKGILDEEIYNKEDIFNVKIKSSEGYTLRGYLIEKYKNNKYMILVHGYSANYHIHMPFARLFLNEGFNVLLVDQRAHGGSEGKYTTYGYYEKNDIDGWIKYLEGKNGEDIYIGLHGQSLGGATVLMCGVNNNKVKFIIDDCGFSNGKEEIKHEFDKQRYIPFKPVYWLLRKKIKCRCNFDMDEVNPLKEIQNSNKPILFIHGKEDKLVPYTMAEDMYNKRANKEDILYLVEDADHMECYGANREKYEEVVRKFISKVNGEN